MARRVTAQPTSQDLPGLEDRAIAAFEQVAADYADVRDQRMALNTHEVTLKQHAIALLKKHHKTSYRRNGIELTLEPGEETLRVRIKKAAEPDEGDDQGPA